MFSKKITSFFPSFSRHFIKIDNLRQSTKNSNGLIYIKCKYFTKSSSTQHMNRHVNDPYVKKSKTLDYRSRGAFKLLEIQEKYKFLRPGQTVLDLGSAPGGWSQIIAPIIKSPKDKPTLISVDLNKMDPITGCHFIQGDFEDEKIKTQIMDINGFQKFDVVCSDMCPEFVGDKFYDHVNTFQLNSSVYNFCFNMLKKNGIMLLKTFDGTFQEELIKNIKDFFKKISRVKPSSSRSESSEIYLFCIGFLENEKLKEKAKSVKEQKEESNPEANPEEQETLIKLFHLAKYSSQNTSEIDELEKLIQKEGGIDSSKLNNIDRESCQKIEKEIIDKENQLMKELEGKVYLEEKDRTYEGYTKKFEKDMEFYEKKLEELSKSENIDKNDEKLIFEHDAIEEYAIKVNQEMEKEMQNLQAETEELQSKIQEEDEEKMVDKLDKNKTERNYEQWERVLSKINEKKNSLDQMFQTNKIQTDLDKNESASIAEFNRKYKNLRKENKEFNDKRHTKIEDSYFDTKNKF